MNPSRATCWGRGRQLECRRLHTVEMTDHNLSELRKLTLYTDRSSYTRFSWDAYRDTTVGCYLMQREYSFLRQLLALVDEPCRVLDIACGSGRTTIPLLHDGIDIIGADLSLAGLQSFQWRHRPVRLVQSDSHCLPFPAHTFDCVVAIQSFEYFDSHQFLQECRRLLRPNGLVVFDFINRHNYKRLLMNALGRTQALDTAYKRSCQEVFQLLINHNFQVITSHGYNWIPFQRQSNSRWVDVMASIESALLLQRLYSISPWILVAARKQNL